VFQWLPVFIFFFLFFLVLAFTRAAVSIFLIWTCGFGVLDLSPRGKTWSRGFLIFGCGRVFGVYDKGRNPTPHMCFHAPVVFFLAFFYTRRNGLLWLLALMRAAFCL
jgi:hypothetical protein